MVHRRVVAVLGVGVGRYRGEYSNERRRVLVSSGLGSGRESAVYRRVLDAGAADPSELQREAQQPGRNEEQRIQRTERDAGQLEDQGDEEQDGSDDGEHGGLLSRPDGVV